MVQNTTQRTVSSKYFAKTSTSLKRTTQSQKEAKHWIFKGINPKLTLRKSLKQKSTISVSYLILTLKTHNNASKKQHITIKYFKKLLSLHSISTTNILVPEYRIKESSLAFANSAHPKTMQQY